MGIFEDYKNRIDQDITNQLDPDTIPPETVGKRFKELADITKDQVAIGPALDKGIAIPSMDPGVLEGPAKWDAIVPGVYTHFGGGTLLAGNIGKIYFDGSTFELTQAPTPQPANKIIVWTATTFATGAQVNYKGQVYEAVTNTTSGQEPGVVASNIWKPIIDRVAKTDLGSLNLISESKFVYDAIINSAGNVNSVGRAGAICVVNLELPNGTYTIGGFVVGAGKYFSLKNSSDVVKSGSNVQITALPYTFVINDAYNRVNFTFKNPTTTEADNSGWLGTLAMSAGSTLQNGISKIVDQPLIASSLASNNTTPDPINRPNAINKGFFDDNAVRKDSIISSRVSNNLINPNVITYAGDWSKGGVLDGYAINNSGDLSASAGWKTAIIPVKFPNPTTYSFGGIAIDPTGNSSFYTGKTNTGKKYNGVFSTGQVQAFVSNADSLYLAITLKRPADADSVWVDTARVSEGATLLPYDPYKTAISKINGEDVPDGGGTPYDQSLNTTDDVEFNKISASAIEVAVLGLTAPIWDETGAPPIGSGEVYRLLDGNGNYFIKQRA